MNNIHVIVLLISTIYFLILKKNFEKNGERVSLFKYIKYISIVPGIIYFYYFLIYKKTDITTNDNIKNNLTNTNSLKSNYSLDNISINSVLTSPYPDNSSINISI